MKVGIFFNLSSYGGVQTCVISLVKGLNEIGIQPDLLTDQSINQKIIDEFGLRLAHVPIEFSISPSLNRRIRPFIQGAWDMFYFFRTSWLTAKYDFVYIFQPNIIVDSSVKYLYYLSMSPRSPGFSGKQLLPRLKFFFYDYFLKHFIPVYEFRDRSSNCVINSGFTQELFFKSFGKRIEVVYPSNNLTVPPGINYEAKHTVLFLSRIDRAKRPELFIELARRFPELDFVMVGTPSNDAYLERLNLIAHQRKTSNLRIILNAPFIEVVEHLRNAKFYVFPAVNEHFGITTVEAAMFGAIPFVHNSGGQKEIVPFDNLRFDDAEFVSKFRELVTMPASDQQLLSGRLLRHICKFSEDVFIEKMLKFLPASS